MHHLNVYVASQAAHEREADLVRRLEHDRVARTRTPQGAVPVRTLRGAAHDRLVRWHLLPAPGAAS